MPRPSVAARKIEAIGYERLRIYFLSRRDQPNRMFRPGTTYNHILQLYECDARLRELSFKAVGRFELAFRNVISETLSAKHGSHPYYDRTAFKSSEAHNLAVPMNLSKPDHVQFWALVSMGYGRQPNAHC